MIDEFQASLNTPKKSKKTGTVLLRGFNPNKLKEIEQAGNQMEIDSYLEQINKEEQLAHLNMLALITALDSTNKQSEESENKLINQFELYLSENKDLAQFEYDVENGILDGIKEVIFENIRSSNLISDEKLNIAENSLSKLEHTLLHQIHFSAKKKTLKALVLKLINFLISTQNSQELHALSFEQSIEIIASLISNMELHRSHKFEKIAFPKITDAFIKLHNLIGEDAELADFTVEIGEPFFTLQVADHFKLLDTYFECIYVKYNKERKQVTRLKDAGDCICEFLSCLPRSERKFKNVNRPEVFPYLL